MTVYMGPTSQVARVVVHYADGLILKGFLRSFDPGKDSFPLMLREAEPGASPLHVRVADLKAVFFVEDFDGEPQYQERKEFLANAAGRRLAVRFHDGEELLGTSLTYHPSRTGFFLFPGDPGSNNDKVFVVASAVTDVRPAA